MSAQDREFPDWITEFVRNSEWGEAPTYMYFWVGVATVAAALRRKVWIDMGTFEWYPNLYTLIVAPPGIVQKSSTADLGFWKILKKIPGIHYGPATLTWQALYDSFAEIGEEFEYKGEVLTQFPLVISSSEFGITLNPRDTEMIDQLVHIWDGREMSKRTRKDGELRIETPCLNMIACTTPSWIAENVPQYLIGGGLTSRMLFVYADAKSKYIAYPQDHIPRDYKQRNEALIRELERISLLTGEFKLSNEAKEWGKTWYEHFHRVEAPKIEATLLGGYIARKQTLVHKVAMCLSASMGNSMQIDLPTLQRAVALISELEAQMPQVYSKIGMTKDSAATEQILDCIKRYGGKMPFALLYRYMHKRFPNVNQFDDILVGLVDASYIKLNKSDGTVEILKNGE